MMAAMFPTRSCGSSGGGPGCKAEDVEDTVWSRSTTAESLVGGSARGR
eukprot:CAMPEP_0176125756 /NCGR_PEP_ID=MMETSP0120_2-20121206/63454_1 /TAXON_ID=160619 /ORGANISM="Kryptoperidinium foliaceum, Strain CCMP 1326" /LENGTH=47 /DNA_ID= /DNA_START= /DNA_END= /DNA_ORIENTATION=